MRIIYYVSVVYIRNQGLERELILRIQIWLKKNLKC